jgi:prophage regulatory protein
MNKHDLYMDHLPTDTKYLSIKDVCKRLSRGYSSIDNDVISGLITPPVKIGGKPKYWPQFEIDTLLAARMAGKDNERIKEIVKSLNDKRDQLFNSLIEKYAAAA